VAGSRRKSECNFRWENEVLSERNIAASVERMRFCSKPDVKANCTSPVQLLSIHFNSAVKPRTCQALPRDITCLLQRIRRLFQDRRLSARKSQAVILICVLCIQVRLINRISLERARHISICYMSGPYMHYIPCRCDARQSAQSSSPDSLDWFPVVCMSQSDAVSYVL
jgi:hypothetical protein